MLAPQRTAVLFPGQGASVAGAGVLVGEYCPELLERCVEALGGDPFERAAESTRFAQPAIFLASIAGWRSLDGAGIEPRAFAGHSVGELSALTAAGVLRAQDGLELVILRGRLMHDAAAAGAGGGMLAVLKGMIADAEQLAETFGLTLATPLGPRASRACEPSHSTWPEPFTRRGWRRRWSRSTRRCAASP